MGGKMSCGIGIGMFFGFSSGGTWTPLVFSGCVLWVRPEAAYVTKDGGNLVSAVADRSGQSVTFTQVTGANQPLWVESGMNGCPILRGDGTDYLLSGNQTWTGITGATIFVVAKLTAAGTYYFTTKGTAGSANAGPGCGYLNSDKFLSALADDAANYSFGETAAGVPQDSPFVLTVQVDATQASAGGAEHAIWVNGTSQTVTLNSSTGAPANMDGASLYGLLANANTTFPMVGDLAEVIYYDNLLSAANRQAVERALGARYGITVA